MRTRIAVIVDADQLNAQAANRLLKTLEEPPPRVRILLSTSRVDALLPTVLSRCVRWRVRPPALEASAAWLAARFREKGREPPPAAELVTVLKRAGLAPGLALRMAGLAGDAEDAGSDGPSIEPLLEAESLGEVLGRAEELTRQAGWPLGRLLQEWEMSLNQSYWRALGGASRPRVHALVRRREVLRQAKRLGLSGRVPLNAQLTCEALALSGRA